MAPPISTITDSDHETSQQHLSHQDKSLHTHLVTKHEPHLAHDITGHTANDLPDSGGGGANFSPGIAKANVAATFARPDGTTEGGWNEKHAHETVRPTIVLRISSPEFLTIIFHRSSNNTAPTGTPTETE